MSRVGQNPVNIPDGVEVSIADGELTAKGKLGTLSVPLLPVVEVAVEDGQVIVKPVTDSKRARTMWGTTRSLVSDQYPLMSHTAKKATEHTTLYGYHASSSECAAASSPPR